jgi:predicted esterase
MRWRSDKSPSEDHGRLPFVRVAYARNLAEAELIQGLLSQENIPSMLQRNGGSDVPEFLAAGGRDVLVPTTEAEHARELLP